MLLVGPSPQVMRICERSGFFQKAGEFKNKAFQLLASEVIRLVSSYALANYSFHFFENSLLSALVKQGCLWTVNLNLQVVIQLKFKSAAVENQPCYVDFKKVTSDILYE